MNVDLPTPNAYAIVDDDGDLIVDMGAYMTAKAAQEACSGMTRRPMCYHPRIVAVHAYLSRYDVKPRPQLIPGCATWPYSYGPNSAAAS